jgi:hypothetical protein
MKNNLNNLETSAAAGTASSVVEWSDRQGSRDRQAGLLVVAGGDCYWFAGGSDQNVAVLSSYWRKDGKWSHTTYRIAVTDGVRVYPARQGWESGKWREGLAKATGLSPLASWEEIASRIGVPLGSLVDLVAKKVTIKVGPSSKDTGGAL